MVLSIEATDHYALIDVLGTFIEPGGVLIYTRDREAVLAEAARLLEA